MIIAAAKLLLIAWLPGALIYRLPIADRDRRAALAAEERLFWQVLISLAVSCAIALSLGAMQRYTFTRLLAADASLAAVLAVAARFRLRLGGARPGRSALIVAGLVALGMWRFFPPAEYIIGGKDPGTYVNEGILLAQRGTLVYDDPLVAAVPAAARPLFFSTAPHSEHYGSRFMGFPLLDLERGQVVGQFPHLFPASIAMGYGIDGLTGARRVVGLWAVLGLIAVYLAGARLLGSVAAGTAAALLGLHVVEVWFARYPNSEVAMQACLFGALLANARAHVDGDRFFGPIAAVLLALLLFLRVDAVIAIAAIVVANLLGFVRGERIQWGFVLVLAAGVAAALPYFLGPMRVYSGYPKHFVLNFTVWHQFAVVASAAGLALLLSAARRHPAIASAITGAMPSVLIVTVWALAVYALWFRAPAGRLALENAHALRMYAAFYVTLPAVIAALVGYALVARPWLQRDPALLLTITFFAVFLFYKIRIVPEHFWAARRFLPVILPGTLLLACAAAAWGMRQAGPRRLVSAAIGGVFVVLLGTSYVRAARPVTEHVEYAGIIPQLERLAAAVGDDELLLVEARDAGSDAHVFGLPLAYIYARNVLVLSSPRPDARTFSTFLEWARTRYRKVYFLGGGGTELLSSLWSARAVSSQRFQIPEFESAFNAYPRVVRQKEFDFGLYELLPPAAGSGSSFDLDVGIRDDLHVVRFHAKEASDGRTMRWSQRQSFVTVTPLPQALREVELVLSSGGRPEAAAPAEVTISLNDHALGTVRVSGGFRAYTLPIPPDAAAAALASQDTSRLRLVSSVWNPHKVIGSGDDRELGVMVDRVQVR